MTKQVRLELDGELTDAGFRVTLEIRDDWSPHAITLKRSLPASADLAALLEHHWQRRYRTLGAPYRIKTKRVIHKGTFSRRWEECKLSAGQLQESFNQWLQSESFQPIYKRLQQELHPREEIHFLIRSNNSLVHKLPWSAWELFEDYPKAEPALSPVDFEPVAIAPTGTTDRVNVLVILGHSAGIDVTKDMSIIQQLPHVEPTFLIEPKRTEISDELWNQPWDIIFFAGHSVTEDEQGVIYINPDESITVDDLWLGLRQAVRRGLQLAIFNSCDGLGLARRLNDLNIPQMVVMRELVPDLVAQQFLSYFLPVFAAGESLYQAVRSARERLDETEEQFPCASWLPVLCQNPTSIPPRWQDLYRLAGEIEDSPPDPPPVPPRPCLSERQVWKRLAVISLVVTLLVMGIRWLGWLETAELLTYDQMMKWRPLSDPIPGVLLVEATDTDIDDYSYPLPDDVLAELLQKLQSAQPLAIGLAMHRSKEREEGREQFIDEFTNNANVVTVCSSDPDTGNLYGAPPEFLDAQGQLKKDYEWQVGFVGMPLDSDPLHTARRYRLSYSFDETAEKYPIQNSKCATKYSFGMQLIDKLQASEGGDINIPPNLEVAIAANNDSWQLGNTVITKISHRYGAYQSLKEDGTQILLSYQKPDKPAEVLSMGDILQGRVEPWVVGDRLVIVGINAPRNVPQGHVSTPYGEMAAVRVQAQLVSQLIDFAHGRQSPIWAMPQWGDALFAWCVGMLGGLLTFRFRTNKQLVIATGIFLFILCQVCLIFLIQTTWLPLIPAGLVLCLTVIVNYSRNACRDG